MHVRNLLILAAASTSTVQASSWFGRFFGWAPAANQPAPQNITPAPSVAQPVVSIPTPVVSTPVQIQPVTPAQPASAPAYTQPPVYVHVHVQPQSPEVPTPVVAKTSEPLPSPSESAAVKRARLQSQKYSDAHKRQMAAAREHKKAGEKKAALNALAIGNSHQNVANNAEIAIVTMSKAEDSAQLADIAATTNQVLREQTERMKESFKGMTPETVENDMKEFEKVANFGPSMISKMAEITSNINHVDPINDPELLAAYDELSSDEEEKAKSMSKQEKKELKAKKLAKKEKKAAKTAKKQEKKAKKQMEQLESMPDTRMEQFEVEMLMRLEKNRGNESNKKRKTLDSEPEMPPAKAQKN